ncbi:MAG TPA: hypothetical protein PK076_01405 [Saprospiraceae bacterium]|nr:hypothetical protein [Saprospiraceae bacterium]HQW54748.1 hypothetical protein [Saprospiraceae bacterium]
MGAAHFHLLLTHFPIVGTILAIGIFAYGLFIKNDSIKIVALSIFVLMSLMTIPVYLTGDGAEEAVEHLADVTKSSIDVHEELAEKAIWLMGILGLTSLIGIYAIAKKLSFSKMLSLIILFISLATFGLFARVGYLGGQIRHTEIITNNNNVQSDNNNDIKHQSKIKDNDD